MDPQLKELLQRNLDIAQDTNRMVHKMRRAQRWGRLFQVVWWIAILAVSGAAYYYYLQPYVVKLEQLYAQVQAGGQQAQNALEQLQTEQQQITNFIAHPFGGGATTSGQ